MTRAMKYVIGLFLLPFTIGFSKAFYAQLSTVAYLGPKMPLFLWGIVIYMLTHILIWKPMYIYTFGHEVVHVVATWICGGHVTSFNVSRAGGSVTTSKTNVFIELSPYFVPIYTLLLIFIMPMIRYALTQKLVLCFYIFLIGFSLGMHLIMNAEVIKLKQPDISRSGNIFSLTFIYIANLIIVFLLISSLSPDISIKKYLLKSLVYSRDIYMVVVHKLF